MRTAATASSTTVEINIHQALPITAAQQKPPSTSKASNTAKKAANWLAQSENASLFKAMSMATLGGWGFWVLAVAPRALNVSTDVLLMLCSATVFGAGAVRIAQNLNSRANHSLRSTA